MNSTVTSVPRRRGRRLLAASAVLGLALGLSACTIGEADDDDNGTAAPQTSATDTAAPAEEPADTDAQPPTGGVDSLILTAADAPELALQPVPAEEITGGLSAIGGLAENMRMEPEHCADFNQDALLEQAEPGTMAIQAGQLGETAFAVAVTAVADELPERAPLIEDCPVTTVTFSIEGQEFVTESTNTLVDLEAPEGVRDFAAVMQDNSMDMMGQPVENGNFLITGSIRGIGVSVTATSTTGGISPEVQDAAMDAFTKQVEKIRDAA